MGINAAPKTLGKSGQKLWRAIASKYDLRPDELAVLTGACETEDMLERIDSEWKDLGRPMMTKGSMGQDIIHPLVAEQKTHRAAKASLLKQLKLPDEAEGAPVNQNRSAGNSRWASAHGAGA